MHSSQGDTRPRDSGRIFKRLHLLRLYHFIDSVRLSSLSLSAVDAISLIQIITASLRWHSPMLDRISAVSLLPTFTSFPPGHFLFILQVKPWDKVNSDMLKMYLAEVLNKLPLRQKSNTSSSARSSLTTGLYFLHLPCCISSICASTSSKSLTSHTVDVDHVHRLLPRAPLS